MKNWSIPVLLFFAILVAVGTLLPPQPVAMATDPKATPTPTPRCRLQPGGSIQCGGPGSTYDLHRLGETYDRPAGTYSATPTPTPTPSKCKLQPGGSITCGGPGSGGFPERAIM